MIGLSFAAALLTLTPTQMESSAAQTIVESFEHVGRAAPATDPALVAAARRLAAFAVDHPAEEASSMVRIAEEVSRAGAADPTPRALVIRSTPPEIALEKLQRRSDLQGDPASHLGIGAAIVGDHAALVVLLAERKATLAPFRRALAHAGGSQRLCGELLAPLQSPELYVTRPTGSVDKILPQLGKGGAFCSELFFPMDGRHSIELVGRGPRGPEVAALVLVDVGATTHDAALMPLAEPTTLEDGRRRVLARINALRAAQEDSPIAADAALDAVAQTYAERMASEHFFGHIAPDGADVRNRLQRAGYHYAHAGENLGYAPGPLAAEFAIEQSPGHRLNLLEPDFRALGIGIAYDHSHETPQALLVEVLAQPQTASTQPLEEAYRALETRRRRLGLPTLVRSEVLEEIAYAQAKRALARDAAAPLSESGLHEQVFAALPEAKLAAADFFVADQPSLLTDSKSLQNPLNDRVGIGAVKGDSATFGRGKYWIVVIYTASREKQ